VSADEFPNTGRHVVHPAHQGKLEAAREVVVHHVPRDARVEAITDAGEMWTAVQSAAHAQRDPLIALAVSGMNDVLNTQADATAAWRNRIPQAAWILMGAIALCSCTLSGYGAPRTRWVLLAILPVVLSVALFLIADIDSPRHGLIRVLPENLAALQQSLPSSR